MKQTFHEIKNLDNPQSGIQFIQREGSASFFSLHPMRNLGKDIKYTADMYHYTIYQSKYKLSMASKSSTTVRIYTYGEEKPLLIKGWTFPSKYEVIFYSSAKMTVVYHMLSFTCKKPDGQTMDVYFRAHDSDLDLIARAITTLTKLSGSLSDYYNYDIYPGFSRY